MYIETGKFSGKKGTKKRWFVLYGHYLTYFKTNVTREPAKDRCLDIRDYIINPYHHETLGYGLQIISPAIKLNTGNVLYSGTGTAGDDNMGMGSISVTSNIHRYEHKTFMLYPEIQDKNDIIKYYTIINVWSFVFYFFVSLYACLCLCVCVWVCVYICVSVCVYRCHMLCFACVLLCVIVCVCVSHKISVFRV